LSRNSQNYLVAMAAAILFLLFTMYATKQSGSSGILSNTVGAIITPLQKGITSATYFVSERLSYFSVRMTMVDEIKRLQQEVLELEQRLRDFDRYKQENESLRDFLGVVRKQPSFEYEFAQVIARDPEHLFYSFTIDKGSLNGVKRYDAVATPEGLAGLVTEVGVTFSKVTAIIDEITPIGAIVSRTRDMGVLESDPLLRNKGFCRINYLPGESSAAPGDSVETSGLGGLFPSGILIGTVLEVASESHNISSYAVVQPAVDFTNVRYVMVVKAFEVDVGA